MNEEWEHCEWEVVYNEDFGLCIKQELENGQYLYHERSALLSMISALDEAKKDISDEINIGQ